MKFTLFFLLAFVFQVSATVYSQSTRFNFDIRHEQLAGVLKQIESTSNFRFFFQREQIDVNRMVDLTASDNTVEEILDRLFKDQAVTYKVLEDDLVLLLPANYNNEELQQITITGKVIDATTSEAMPGVNIQVKGMNIGTITGTDGTYSLNVNNRNASLVFSFIGYVTQEIPLNGKTILDVSLNTELKGLEEVVVVGYGTVKKSDLTGSVSSIAPRAFLNQPASSINSVLTGKVPGVTVRRSNGAPGQGATIRIRGANSLLGSNDPLIVVDGNYSSIPNMYDIESIEILKDASATAIYGSRGANGVILVKTKRGTQEKPSVQLYSDFSFDNISQRYDLMDPYEFAEFSNRTGVYPFTDDQLAKIKAEGGTDWQDAIMQTGLSQNYKAVFTGGSKAVKYYISPSYNKATGTIKNTEASGYGLGAKVDMDLSDRITVQIESSIGHGDNLNPGLAQGGSKTSIPLCGAVIWAPTESIYNEDGTYRRLGIGTGSLLNPLLMTDLESTNYSNSGSGVGNLKIKIIEGLVFDAKGSVSIGTGGSRYFENKQYNGVNPYAGQSSYESKSWLVNSFLTFTRTFGGVHNLSAMAGFEGTQSTSQNMSATANILPIESVGWYNLGLASPNIGVGSGYSNGAMRSYFGRVNYNYASRYYLTMNYRADGSSKFKGDNMFGYFPSFSMAWRLSEEKFMKNQNLFQNLKIRGGWGVTGSQAIGNYATYTTLGSRSFDWGDVTQAGYFARVGGNPNLKWESTGQLDLGLDLTTLDGSLSLSVDYYNKKTVDLLAPVSVTAYNGGDPEYGEESVISNVGSVRNEGLEFNINYDVLNSSLWSYSVNLNGAFNRNKVLDIGEQNMIYGATYAPGLSSQSPFILKAGEPIGTIWGMKYLGIWQESEAEEAAKFQQTPGDYKYQDLNGNSTYDSGDNQVIGNTNPSFTWGFNNLVSYKNFDLNVLLEGVQGRDVMNWAYMVASERIDFSQLITLRAAKNRWTPANPDAEFAKMGNSNRLNPLSSQYMQDGSYIKLRNVSLAYRIPKNVLSFAAVKLSVSAQNLLTITKYKGYDPEISSTSGSDTSSGMDWFAYPNPMSFSFGISIEY